MKENLNEAAEKLLKSGRLDGHKQELEIIIASGDGRHVQQMMEQNGVADAVQTGDMETVRAAVGNLLRTPEGARLAEQISKLLK